MMPRLAPGTLAAAHLTLMVLVLGWNLWVAGRAARWRTTPRSLAVLCAAAGLLIVPALTVMLVSNSLLTGRALHTIAWVWPVTTVLVAAQAVLAVTRGIAAPAIGAPIAVYDIIVALIALVQYFVFRGADVGEALLSLLAASRGALAITAQPRALLEPVFAYVPIFAPATPTRRSAGTIVRTMVAAVAVAWTTFIVLDVPEAARAVNSFDRYAGVRLHERADSDFAVGIKILPRLDGEPIALALDNDLALADSVGAEVVSVYVSPAGATATALDSLGRALESRRTDRALIIALDFSGEHPVAEQRRGAYFAARVSDVERIVSHLHPDYVVPVLDPVGVGTRSLGRVSRGEWLDYLRAAAERAHATDAKVGVLVHVGGFTPSDSAIVDWARLPGVPVEAVGVSLFPWTNGARALDDRMRAADRWLASMNVGKPVWVLETGGFPMTYGDLSQSRAITAALAWATGRSVVKGLVVFEASDYAAPMGLRSSSGRVRAAGHALARAVKAKNSE